MQEETVQTKTNTDTNSQVFCKGCKGACNVYVNDKLEICNVCEGTGIEPNGK